MKLIKTLRNIKQSAFSFFNIPKKNTLNLELWRYNLEYYAHDDTIFRVNKKENLKESRGWEQVFLFFLREDIPNYHYVGIPKHKLFHNKNFARLC